MIHHRLARYSVAPVTVALALLCRMALNPYLQNASPFMYFFVAIIVSGWLGGLGPGLLATFLSGLVVDYFYLDPPYTILGGGTKEYIQISSFMILGAVVSLIIARMRHERRRAEQAADEVRTSEIRYRATYEHADIGIERLDEQGRLVEVNPALCRMLGYTSEELLARTFVEITHPYDRTEESRLLEELKSREIPSYKLEKRYLRKDGQPVWVRLTSSLAPEGAGFYRISIAEDITARKHAEEAQRESEERFRTMADSLPQLAWIAQADGFIFWYNRRWYEYTGTTPEQMEGWGWQSVHDPDVLPQVLVQWKGSIASGKPFDMVFPLRGADGQFRPFLTRVMPFKDEQGRVVQWFGTNTDVDELKRAEESLRESEQRLSLAQQAARIGSFDWNIQTNVNIWSPELEAMYGLQPGEFGRTQTAWEQLVYPEDRQLAIGLVNRAFETDEPVEGEWRVQWPDGSVHWIFGRFQVLKDETGKPLRLTGVNIDITERRRMENALRESREWLRVTLSSIGDAVIACDSEGLITFLNPEAAALTGWEAQEALGQPIQRVFRIINEHTRQDAEDIAARVLREGHVVGLANHTALISKDGREISIEDSAAPIKNEAGDVSGIVLVFHDVTQKRLAQEALRESEERFRLLVDGVKDHAIFMLDHEGNVATWNAGAQRIKGYAANQIIGQHFSLFYTPEDKAANKPGRELAIATEQGVFTDEGWRVRQDSSRFWASVTITPVRDESGKLRGFAKVTRDITERKRTEETLRENEALLRAATDNASIGLVMLDRERRYTFANPAYAKILGLPYSAAELIGKGPAEVLAAVYETQISPRLDRAFAGERVTYQLSRPHTDGSLMHYSVIYDPQREATGVSAVIVTIFDITELKRVEAELERHRQNLEQLVHERTDELRRSMDLVQAERQRFKDVLDMLPAYLVLISPDYRVPFANRFFEERFGKSEGRRCHEYLFNRPEPCENCETFKVLKTGEPHHWLWTGPDGRNYEIHDFPFTDTDGSPLIMEVGLDITERKKAEAAVQAERQRLFDVLETLPAMICLLTQDYHITFANRSFRERFGESHGRHCYDYCFGRSEPCDFCESYNVLKTGEPHQWEVAGPDGSVIEAYDFPFTDVDGTPMILEMDFDITARRKAETELAAHREHLEELVKERTAQFQAENAERQLAETRLAADLAALTRMHDLSGKRLEAAELEPLLQEVMDAAVAIVGADKGTLQLLEGDSLRIVAHHGHEQPFLEFFAAAENCASVCGEATRRGERVVVPDVETSPIFTGTPSLAVLREAGVGAVQSTPMISRAGVLLGILTTHWGQPYSPDEHDLWRIDLLARQAADLIETVRADTGLRQANAELTEADRRKNEFLAMLAHELRNPLAPVRYAVQIMSAYCGAGCPSHERISRQREIIERHVGQMAHLIDDLLDVARISRGKVELRKEMINLIPVLQQAVDSCRQTMEQKQQELIVDLPEGPQWLEGDKTRLNQVFHNLLDNASKYSPASRRIWVSADVEWGNRGGAMTVVRVRDEGPGISSELLPYIFDLFTQGERGLDRSQGGLGIGLTMVRNLIKMHGGTVEARSAGQDQGSEFVVRLPLIMEPEAQGALPGETLPSSTGGALKILAVDDIVDTAQSLAELLELCGHQARVAFGGETALEIARTWHPEVVLLDIGMPGMDGYEVARRLRAEHGKDGMTIVALTGYGQASDRAGAKDAGFDELLVKPVDLDVLRKALEKIAERITKR